MKTVIPYLVTLILFFSGCSPISHFVQARFETIDENVDSLRIHFRFTRDSDSTFPVGSIVISNKTSRICTYYSQTTSLTEYTFPDVPEGFTLTYHDGFDSLYLFSKREEYFFRFHGFHEFVEGYWLYLPQFAEADHRWLFDSLGNYRDDIRVSYVTWLGKDDIYLDFAQPVTASESDIVLKDSRNTLVPFTFYAQTTPGRLYTLELEHDLDGDEPFTLYLSPSLFSSSQDSLLTLRLRADSGSSIKLSAPRFSELRR